jgi:hypothetical protein
MVLIDIVTQSREGEAAALIPAQAILRTLVLDSVPSVHSKRNYAKALDDLFAFCASRPLTRALLMKWRVAMEALSPSTINVRLSAARKLVSEARRNGMIGQDEAATVRAVIGVTGFAGLRKGEIRGLWWRTIAKTCLRSAAACGTRR